MKRSLVYLELRQDQSAEDLERRLSRLGDALAAQCEEVTRARPIASLAAACALGALTTLAVKSGPARSTGRSLGRLALLRTLAAGLTPPSG